MKNIRTSTFILLIILSTISFMGGYGIAKGIRKLTHRNPPSLISPTGLVEGIKATPALLPLTGSIIFVSDREGNWEIYRMDLSNLKTENLTLDPSNDMNPQLSPNGKSMVFFSDRDGINTIYEMDLETKSVKQLTKNTYASYDPSYSPDGSQIVFKSNKNDKNSGNGDIFIMKRDGTGQKNLTIDRPKTEEWDPSFTADGKQIVFVSRLDAKTEHASDEIFVMDTDGKNLKQITENEVPDWYPSVDHTNQQLLFVSNDDSSLDDDIYTSSIDGSNRLKLTTLPGDNSDPAWDLKTEKIVFLNNSDGDYDLYIMDYDGSNVRKIEDNMSDELSPIFVSEVKQ